MDRLTAAERADLNLKVFFASAEPELHPSWNQPWLRSAIDEIYTYADVLSPDSLKHMHTLEKSGQDGMLEKSVTDYAIALRHCYDVTTSPYIAIFEDDILLADGWLVRSILGLKDVEREMARQGRAGEWLSMRLFNQERSIGWLSRKVGGNNEHWISLAISSVLGVFLLVIRRHSYRTRARLDNWSVAVICFIAVPSFVVLFFQCGKASLLPPSAGVKQEPFGCCAQGMIFPRAQIPGLIAFLQSRATDRPLSDAFAYKEEVGKYDMLTRDYSRGTGLARWSLYPVQIQHLGTCCRGQH